MILYNVWNNLILDKMSLSANGDVPAVGHVCENVVEILGVLITHCEAQTPVLSACLPGG